MTTNDADSAFAAFAGGGLYDTMNFDTPQHAQKV